jgi:hypothetical protein
MKSNLTKALLFLTAGISGLSIAFAADKAMANDLPDNTYFRLRTNTGSYVNKSGNILAPVSGANTLSKLTDSNVMYVKSRGPNGSAELANATSTNTCLGLATGLDVNAINTNSKVVYLSCDKAFNWQLTTGKLSLAITNGKFCLVTAADKRGSGQPLSIELCNSNSPVRYRVQSNTNDSDPIGFMLPPVVVPPVVVPPVVVPPVVVPPPVVPPVVVPPVVVPPKANQSDQLVNGQFFVFLNQTLNQPMNVRGGANGTKINGSPATIDFDKEMITKVGIKPNSNIIQIEANGKVVSVKENSVSGSLLETYNKVGYFDPYQSFYHDTLPNGNIILTSVKYPHLAINLKYGGKNEQFAPYMLWDKNGIEKDTDLQFKAKSIPGYVEKQVIDDPITTASSCIDHGCIRSGYNGIDPWGYHEFASIRQGFKHNCTAYAAWWLAKNGQPAPNRRLGNAKSWAYNAREVGMTVQSSPKAGAVGVRTIGDYGHVAVIEQVNGDGTLWISEDNYDESSGGYSSSRLVKADYFQEYIIPVNLR